MRQHNERKFAKECEGKQTVFNEPHKRKELLDYTQDLFQIEFNDSELHDLADLSRGMTWQVFVGLVARHTGVTPETLMVSS